MGCWFSRNNYQDIPELPRRKVLFVGPKGIGKTHFLCQKTNIPIHTIEPTVGVDFFRWDHLLVTYFIWDTSGSPRFYPILQKCIERVQEVWVGVSDSQTPDEKQRLLQEWYIRLGEPNKQFKIISLPSGTFYYQ
jgi:GTPase SAR1 family protein